jgi:membrane protein YdbS with pleckstrin-like domain
MVGDDRPGVDAPPGPDLLRVPASSGPAGALLSGLEQRLDPRVITLQRWTGSALAGGTSALVLVGILVIAFLGLAPLWGDAVLLIGWAAASAGLVQFLGQRWPEIRYRHASYSVDGHGITIWRGVLWREVIRVPRSRVQHTDISQGPLERRLGLATLAIYTAGTLHACVSLPGLSQNIAPGIRDHLIAGGEDDGV